MSDNTTASYRYDLATFDEWARGIVDNQPALTDPRNPTLNELRAHIQFLAEKKDLGPASIARHVASLKGFYRFLRLDESSSSKIAELLESPKLWNRIPYVLSVKQVRCLLESPQEEIDRYALRDRAILEFLYGSGCRVSEAADLRLEDLHLDSAFVQLEGKGDKARTVPIGHYAILALAEYMRVERPKLARGQVCEYVFLSQATGPNRQDMGLKRCMIWHILKRYAKRAGLTDKVTVHTLRHSYATHMLKNGADLRVIQELLGHSLIITTQIYTTVDVNRLRQVHARCHPHGAAFDGGK